MRRTVKILYRFILPMLIAYALLVVSPQQQRTQYISNNVDFVIRLSIVIWSFIMFWKLGDVLIGKSGKLFSGQADRFPYYYYPHYNKGWAFFSIVGLVGAIVGMGLISKWVMNIFLPRWASWVYVADAALSFIFGGSFIIFWVKWIKWWQRTL